MSKEAKSNEYQDIAKLEEEISNFFEDIMYDRGGSPLLGRIYALCVLADPEQPLFQKDLVEKFGVNPSTISRNLKDLENWRLIVRRREPGSREWRYQVDSTSFFELMVNKFEETATTFRERGDDLRRIREHFGRTLSDQSKKTEEGARFLQTLDFLIKWISLVEQELGNFTQTLHKRFLELDLKTDRL